MSKKISEVIEARGHPLITASHQSTFMITKEGEIGIEADCAVGVAANKGAADLRDEIKRELAAGREAKIVLKANGKEEKVQGRGANGLSFRDPSDLVVRTSDFVCERTILVNSDKAASDFSRDFVKVLQDSSTTVKVIVKILL